MQDPCRRRAAEANLLHVDSVMAKKALSMSLGGALALASFLSLGMGMDMGAGWAPEASHGCCPSGPAERASGAECCLFLPAAVPASVALPGPVRQPVALVTASSSVAADAASRPLVLFDPPGDDSPGNAVPSAPRAPPAA